MAYDKLAELKKVKAYYDQDALQKRFSALILGESGAGKTFILRTARRPIHIDSFDPGGTKCLRDLINSGDVIADTQWEKEDPYNPKVFANWMRATDIRLQTGYFEMFGTYCIDSASTWGDAIMNYQLNSQDRAGEAPKFTRDYTPQKILMINYIKKLMNIPCDFVLTGHLREIEEVVGSTKEGSSIKKTKYRFNTTGRAVITIPLQFDEIYVLVGKPGPQGIKRELLIDSQGQYVARSRLKADNKLSSVEAPDIKRILKKIGLNWQDKPKLDLS